MSDTCAKGENIDRSGSLLEEIITNKNRLLGNLFKGDVICTAIVPDDKDMIMVTVWIYFFFFLFILIFILY